MGTQSIYFKINYRAVAALNKPFVTKIEDDCSSNECFQGIYADVWHALQHNMNFTFTIRRDRIYGSLVNDTWNGMIGID